MWKHNKFNRGDFMIYVGIDVAKNKHDCCIIDSNDNKSKKQFIIENNIHGFNSLIKAIPTDEKVKVGLEATGHYSINIASFLNDNGFTPIILNPLQTNLFGKALTLRKTKTDKTDALLIASMLSSDDFKPHLDIDYQLLELKSLTRFRSRSKNQCSKLKISLNRILDIMFPELITVVYSINQKSTMALLTNFPSLEDIQNAHLTKLTNILKKSSRGKYGKNKAIEIKTLATKSIGSKSKALSFELLQTINSINFINEQIKELDNQIKDIMMNLESPIISIPGISYNLGSIILSEIGDINRFDSSSQLVAFAGIEPAMHQSGNFKATKVKMVKRGSPYLRWAILQAANRIWIRDNTFKEYYLKKKSEGKHHLVVLTHVAKKLIRVIFHLLKNDLIFEP